MVDVEARCRPPLPSWLEGYRTVFSVRLHRERIHAEQLQLSMQHLHRDSPAVEYDMRCRWKISRQG